MLRRLPDGPLITRADLCDVPPRFTDVSAVFNPGAVRLGDRTLLLLRVQNRGRETGLMCAWSHDGLRFDVEPRLVEVRGLESAGVVHHVYDPRLTLVDGELLCCVAVDTEDGCRLATGRLDPDGALELTGLESLPSRNGVLFPRRFDGRWARLERPNDLLLPDGVRTGDAIVYSTSDDLRNWRVEGEVLRGRTHFWDELIGAGPPPILTAEGWLLVYHGVATHFGAAGVYQAGVALLDVDHPTRVVARGTQNVLEPRTAWETVGQVPNVVFPTGLIVEGAAADAVAAPGARVHLYYGAADTCVGLAVATVGDLLAACRV